MRVSYCSSLEISMLRNAFSTDVVGVYLDDPERNSAVKRRIERASSDSFMIRSPNCGCHPQFKQRISTFLGGSTV